MPLYTDSFVNGDHKQHRSLIDIYSANDVPLWDDTLRTTSPPSSVTLSVTRNLRRGKVWLFGSFVLLLSAFSRMRGDVRRKHTAKGTLNFRSNNTMAPRKH